MNRRISISLGRTINTGNYASLRVDVSLETDLLDGEQLSPAMEELQVKCHYYLVAAIKKEQS